MLYKKQQNSNAGVWNTKNILKNKGEKNQNKTLHQTLSWKPNIFYIESVSCKKTPTPFKKNKTPKQPVNYSQFLKDMVMLLTFKSKLS